LNHKRRRPKFQRAGCNCGGKLAKNLRATRRGKAVYGSRGSELRLSVRMREAA
jgi:hypothetical protein